MHKKIQQTENKPNPSTHPPIHPSTKILIIGASGLVGSNCLKVFSEVKGWEVMGTWFSHELPGLKYFNTLEPEDERNKPVLEFKPDVILHAGALSHVDYCEQHPEESYEKTVVSTKNVLELAKRFNSKVIYISTDYVFDGKDGPYCEDDDVNPLSVYARHKLEAERMVLDASEDNLSIRITNVYGNEDRNKNFVARIVQNIKEGKEMTLNLPFDQYATPVNAYDIGRALQLMIKDGKSGVYNIASTDYMNRVQLAQKILSYFPHYKTEINSKSTIELNQAAPRPLQGGLKSGKFLAEYTSFEFSNVDDFLKQAIKE